MKDGLPHPSDLNKPPTTRLSFAILPSESGKDPGRLAFCKALRAGSVVACGMAGLGENPHMLYSSVSGQLPLTNFPSLRRKETFFKEVTLKYSHSVTHRREMSMALGQKQQK